MHPVFVEAVKRHEIGAPPNTFLLSSAPGTIPATVRPPRIPELADTPIMTASAPRQASEPQTHMAIAEPEAPAATPSGSGGLFGSLFSTKSASASESKIENPFDRMANFIGLGGSEPNKAKQARPARQAAAVPEPRTRPAVRKTQTATQPVTQPVTHVASHGAIRPKPAAEPEPVKSAEARRPAPSPWPAVPPPATAARAPAQPSAQWWRHPLAPR